MVVDCGNNKKKIQLFSFGIPGQGFYAMEFPEEQMKKEQTIGLVSVYEGLANEERLNEELKDVVNDKWDFQPRWTLMSFWWSSLTKDPWKPFQKLGAWNCPNIS